MEEICDFIPSNVDRRNPVSLQNMLPKKIGAAIDLIPMELWALSETDLVHKAYGTKRIPPEDSKLRYNLWRLYAAESAKHGGRIRPADWFRGAATSKYFELHILQNQEKLCYICREPAESWLTWEHLYREALPEMVKILQVPIGVDLKTGLPDTKLMDLKMRIFMYLDGRQHGVPAIRTESKNLNVSMNLDKKETLDKFKSPEDLDRRLKELEAELARPQLAPVHEPATLQIGVIDIPTTEKS